MKATQKKIFIYDKLEVFFKHTDYYGFVHPYNFFEWTSYVREAFFSQMCGDFRKLLESPVKMMTVKINADIENDSKFGDHLEARLTVTKVKRVSLDVLVKFINKQSKVKIAETRHTLVFVDSKSQRFTSIPENVEEAVAAYQE